MPYQIGVTPANMVELTDLGLPNPLYAPLSDFSPFSSARRRMDGALVGTGRPVITWRFNRLTIAQTGVLLHYVDVGGALAASNVTYIRTRILQANMTDRVFQSYQATLVLPFEPREMRYGANREFTDVTLRFINAVPI